MKKAEKIYIHDLTVALGGILIIITLAWYFFAVINEKTLIDEQIGKIKSDCNELKELKSKCDITQKSYSLSYDILCGAAINGEIEKIQHMAEKSNNLWEIIRLRKATLGLFDAINADTITMAEISEASDFYAGSLSLKVNSMINIGALESGCAVNKEILKKYAKCDIENMQMLLPDKKRRLVAEYYGIAKRKFAEGDYIAAIHYTAAAVAYQDNLARAQYKDLLQLEEKSLVCLGE